MEEEAEELAGALDAIQKKFDAKKKELEAITEEEQKAQLDLEKLAKDADKDGAEDGDDNEPLGPPQRAQRLVDQVADYMPGGAKDKLAALFREACDEAQKQFMEGWGKAGSDDAKANSSQGKHESQQDEPDPGAMEDLADGTIELLDVLCGAACKEDDDKEAGTGDSPKRGILSAIKKHGATPAKLRAVARDLKTRKGLHGVQLKPKGTASNTAGGGSPKAPVPVGQPTDADGEKELELRLRRND